MRYNAGEYAACTCNACCRICKLNKERVNCNKDYNYNKDRHEHFRILFDSLFNTLVNNYKAEKGKNHGKENWLPLGCNKACKESVFNSNLTLEGEVAEHVLHYPATDYTIIGHDNHRYYTCQNTQKSPAFFQLGIRAGPHLSLMT